MPHFRWVLIGAILSCTGCGACLTQVGTNVSTFPTREVVHQELGQPTASGVVEGQPYEEFVTHRVIAQPEAGVGVTMLDCTTFFLAELVLFPYEIYLTADRSIEGQTLRFTYDNAGNVKDIQRDGKPAFAPPFNALSPPTDIQPLDAGTTARLPTP